MKMLFIRAEKRSPTNAVMDLDFGQLSHPAPSMPPRIAWLPRLTYGPCKRQTPKDPFIVVSICVNLMNELFATVGFSKFMGVWCFV